MHNPQIIPQSTAAANPIIEGNCRFQIDDKKITITVDKVLNTRPAGDVSGTLALELWALRQPYNGGDFNGVAVAGAQVGELFGQYFVANNQFTLDFAEPPVGSWYLTLMLREWTKSGFVTRDFVNFPVPYIVNWIPELVHNTQGKVVNLPVERELKPDAEKPAETTKEILTEVEKTADKTPIETKEPQPKAPVVTETKKAAPEKTVRAETTKQAKAKKTKAVAEKLLINTASLEQVQNLKGVSTALAKEIVARRPYKNLDELLKVKGMGAKLLAKIKPQLEI